MMKKLLLATLVLSASTTLVKAQVTSSNATLMSARSVSNLVASIVATTATGDSDAAVYIQNNSLNAENGARYTEFVKGLKNISLWSNLVDGFCFRTNYNPHINTNVTSIKGALGVCGGNVWFDGAGAHFNGVDSYISESLSISSTNSIVIIYSGSPTGRVTQSMFTLGNHAGYTAGSYYMDGNGLGECKLMAYFGGSETIKFFVDAQQSSDGSAGYLYPSADPRQRMLTLTWNNQGQATGIIDNWLSLTNYGVSTRISEGYLDTLVIGARNTDSTHFDNFFTGVIADVFVFNTALTSNQVYSLQKVIRWLQPGDKNVLFIGDSMTGWNSPASGLTNYWPIIRYSVEQMGYELGQAPYDSFYPVNLSRSGNQASTWNGNLFNTFYGNYGIGGPVKSTEAYVLIGINDIGTGSSASTAFNNWCGIMQKLRAIGANPIVAMTLPNVGAIYKTNWFDPMYSTNTTARWAYNNLIRSNAQYYDKLVDLDVAFPVSSMNTNATPLWTLDGLHMTAEGQSNIVKQIISVNPERINRGNLVGGDKSYLMLGHGYGSGSFLEVNGINFTNTGSALSIKDPLGSLFHVNMSSYNADWWQIASDLVLRKDSANTLKLYNDNGYADLIARNITITNLNVQKFGGVTPYTGTSIVSGITFYITNGIIMNVQ